MVNDYGVRRHHEYTPPFPHLPWALSFVLVSFVSTFLQQGSNQVIRLLGSGSGGLSELCAALKEDMVAFCALRVTGAGGDARSPRFHRILFVGEEVGGMKRGRAALQKNAVFAVFDGVSAEDREFKSLSELAEAPTLKS